MKKRNLNKLSLSRETVRSLTEPEFGSQWVAGGIGTARTCGNPCSIACSNWTCETCQVRCGK